MALRWIWMVSLLPLAGCGGFDRYDGRWVADVPPRPPCCPARIAIDVEGRQLAGTDEDCNGVLQIKGRIDKQGTAAISVDGQPATLRFTGEDFETVLPQDRCARHVVGNRGG